MEQTKALNALEPFLALTKSATSSRAAADLIARATSAPNTFVFAELLAAPQIQALATAPESASLTLLQIFSYGTYSTYKETASLPDLNPAQTQKLRQLSLLTLAQDPASLSYSKLISALGLGTDRELEDLVISAIYAGLVEGTLDPYNRVVLLSAVSPLRDVAPNSITSLISTLSTWSSRCTTTLSELELQISQIRAVAKKRLREEKDWALQVERLIDGGWGGKLGGRLASKRGNDGSADDSDDGMDLDEDDDEGDERRGSTSKPNKKRGGFLSGFGK